MSGYGCFHTPTTEPAWLTKPNIFAVGLFAEKVCQPRPYTAASTSLWLSYTKCRKDSRLLTGWGETLTGKHMKTKTLISSSIFLVMKLYRNQPTREPSPALVFGRKGTDRGQGQSWACCRVSSLSGGFTCGGQEGGFSLLQTNDGKHAEASRYVCLLDPHTEQKSEERTKDVPASVLWAIQE